ALRQRQARGRADDHSRRVARSRGGEKDGVFRHGAAGAEQRRRRDHDGPEKKGATHGLTSADSTKILLSGAPMQRHGLATHDAAKQTEARDHDGKKHRTSWPENDARPGTSIAQATTERRVRLLSGSHVRPRGSAIMPPRPRGCSRLPRVFLSNRTAMHFLVEN